MIKCEIINDFAKFLKLERSWNELVVASEIDHAFMKHQWFAEWIKSYDVQNLLSIPTLWQDGLLCAVAPIYRRQFRFRKIRVKGLSFLSSGVSPRCNFIVSEKSSLRELVKYILALPEWDVFSAENLEEEIDITRMYRSILSQDLSEFDVQVSDGLHSPFFTAEGTWQEYYNSLNVKRRKYLERMCIRRLQKADNWAVERIESAEQFESFLPYMLDISGKSWKSTLNNHITLDSQLGRFYTGFTPVGLKNGWVNLHVLKVKDETIAFEYLLSCNNKYSLIRCDYNQAFKYYSPGNNLRLAILKELFDRGTAYEYDMGGEDYPYKLEWCSKIRRQIIITLGNRTALGRAVLFGKNKMLPFLRKIKGRLPGRSKTP